MPRKAKGALVTRSTGADWRGDLQRRWAQIAVIGEDRYDALKAYAEEHNIPETIACRVILNAGIEQINRISRLKRRALELMEDRRVYQSSSAQ